MTGAVSIRASEMFFLISEHVLCRFSRALPTLCNCCKIGGVNALDVSSAETSRRLIGERAYLCDHAKVINNFSVTFNDVALDVQP